MMLSTPMINPNITEFFICIGLVNVSHMKISLKSKHISKLFALIYDN